MAAGFPLKGLVGRMKKRIVIGISGASGAPLAVRLLREIKKQEGLESHLVVSEGGRRTIEEECGCPVKEIMEQADVCYDNRDIGAAIASGTFPAEGMVIIPCSMKTLSGLVHGYTENLLLRTADVTMKEQRRLVIVPRETPMSVTHLDNLSMAARIPGVMVIPPVVTYYNHPQTIEDMETHLVGKILRVFGWEADGFRGWC